MKELKEYIWEIEKGPNAPSILIENVNYRNSREAYHARILNQQHYNGETYQMQLDSHHRFVKDWDTKCIKMLHDSDAGEYSVLTIYGPGYG